MLTITYDSLSKISAQHGFALSILPCSKLTLSDSVGKILNEWCLKGYGGEMNYLKRANSDPLQLFPGIKSILVLGASYGDRVQGICPPGYGRVARYAWGLDYHEVMPRRIQVMLAEVQTFIGQPFKYRICCDSAPVMEKVLGESAGMGWRGAHSLLLAPGMGSFFFLAEVLCDLEVSGLPPRSHAKEEGCTECHVCERVCPGKALKGRGCLDARRCISYLTVEKKGVLSWQERELIGEWVFGCDLCQEVCPYNQGDMGGDVFPEFRPDQGVGPFLELGRVLTLRSEVEFRAYLGKTALRRVGRERLLRNAAVVAGNMRAYGLLPCMLKTAREDPSPLVRRHVLWALSKLASGCDNSPRKNIKDALVEALKEGRDGVAEEARVLLELI